MADVRLRGRTTDRQGVLVVNPDVIAVVDDSFGMVNGRTACDVDFALMSISHQQLPAV